MPPGELAAQAKRAIQPGHGAWSHTDLLLAAMFDRLSWLIYATYHAQGGKPKNPEPYPRPGVTSKKTRIVTPEGLAYLQRLRERRGAAE